MFINWSVECFTVGFLPLIVPGSVIEVKIVKFFMVTQARSPSVKNLPLLFVDSIINYFSS